MNTLSLTKIFLAASICAIGLNAAIAAPKTDTRLKTIGSIRRNDEAMDKIIPTNAVVEIIARGYSWAEGPIWIKSGSYLVFSDVQRNTLNIWKEGVGAKIFSRTDHLATNAVHSDHFSADGVTLDSQGRLVLCGHAERRVTRIETDLQIVTIANKFEGKRLNSPNDLVYKSNGDLYFTDPPYGLDGKNESPDKELEFNGVYRLAPDGKLTLLAKDLLWPNGIAFSPDEKTLYIANSDPKRALWMAYGVKENGTLDKGRVFFDATKFGGINKGLPNGIKVDRAGNIYATGFGGVFIFNSEGKHLGTIFLNENTTNCAWGDDGSTLYITTAHMVCRIRTTAKGLGF